MFSSKVGYIFKDKNMVLFMATLFVIVAFLYIRDLRGVEIPKMFFVVISVIPALFLDFSSIVYLLFFLMPLRSGLPENYLFPLLIFILIIKNKTIAGKTAWLCFFLVFFMEILHYPFYGFEIKWQKVLNFLAYFFLFIVFLTSKNRKIEVDKCVLFYCIGIAVFFFALYYLSFFVAETDLASGYMFRIGKTKDMTGIDENLLMLNENPNGIAFLSISGLACILSLFRMKKCHIVPFLLCVVAYLVVGALTVSRTWILCVAILFVMYILMGSKKAHGDFIRKLFSILLVISIGSYYFIKSGDLVSLFEVRMTDESFTSAGSRTELLSAYNSFMAGSPQYLFLGTGSVHYRDVAASSIFGVNQSCHNAIQQVFVSYGVIGLLIFSFIFIRAFKINYTTHNFFLLLPFIMTFVFSQSTQFLNPAYNLFPFIAAFYVMRLENKNTIALRK